MKQLLFLILLFAFSAGIVQAQCAPTCSSYVTYTVPYGPLSPAGINAVPLFLPNSDDGCTSPINIGFTFNYYCTNYNSVLIYSNGMIQLNIGQPSSFAFGYDPAQLFGGTTAAPNALVAFRMDDLDPTQGGSVTYTTIGSTPNQSFVVTYSNVPLFSNTSSLHSGQIILHETSNIIDIISISSPYHAVNFATQGIENATGTSGTAVPGRNMSNWSATAQTWRFQGVSPAPPSAITGTTSTCQGLTNTYSITPVTGASYNWSLPPNWFGTSTISAITPTAGNSGVINVTATYSCGTSAPSSLTVNVIPAPLVAFSSATPAIFCSGTTVTFQTSGAASYTLQPGNITGTPPFFNTPLQSTTYTLTGTNASGCLSNIPANTNITVKETPTVVVNSGGICIGNTFNMTPTGANAYVYSSVFSGVTPSASGVYNYSVVGTSTNGCISNTAIASVTVYALPSLSVAVTRTSICVKQTSSLTAAGAATYTWNLSTPTASNAAITVTPQVTTIYSVTGTDAKGCVNSQSATVIVNACAGIGEEMAKVLVHIYPNPARGALHLVLSTLAQVQVYDALGREVLKGEFPAGDQQLNMSELPAGQYLIRIHSGAVSETRRFILE